MNDFQLKTIVQVWTGATATATRSWTTPTAAAADPTAAVAKRRKREGTGLIRYFCYAKSNWAVSPFETPRSIRHWIGFDWIGLDWIGLVWIGLSFAYQFQNVFIWIAQISQKNNLILKTATCHLIGLDWIGLDWILICIPVQNVSIWITQIS